MIAQRVTQPPRLLLLLVAVAEGTAGETAVLVEEAVGVDLDHGRAATGAHVLDGLGHGEVDGERVLPSTFQDARLKPMPRAESRGSAVASSTEVETA